MRTDRSEQTKPRYGFPDTVRGILILGMIAYHTLFDIAVVYGIGMDTPLMRGANVLRDVGAACFVFLSGFCFHFGRRNVRKGLILLGAGFIVTAATYLFDRESAVIFGVLTFLGTAKLLLCALERPFRYIPPVIGAAVSFFLVLLFFRCNFGYAGFGGATLFRWPSFLYRDHFTAFFGFPGTGFASGDYFGLLPWFFISCCGWFTYRVVKPKQRFARVMAARVPLLDNVGRYSLWIYLIHQPMIYSFILATKKWFL